MSTLSGKTLPSETTEANVYTNEGFSQDDDVNNINKGQKQLQDTSNNSNINNKSTSTTGNPLKKSNTSPGLNNATESGNASGEAALHYDNPIKKVEDDNSAYYNIKKDGGTGGSVDFDLPSAGKGRERSRSVLSEDRPYRGMGKEELLRYSSRPLWRNLRYACMSIVLTGWLALLITVVALVLTYPHCRDAHRKDWWQKTVVYRIYVRSFMDTTNDGIGDINGTIKQLGYLQDIGVGTISLSPIYKLAPKAPTDTHIVNHMEIDPVFGTMDDFKNLVNETHARGMHLILDFIPNHTSDKHPWFLESVANGDPRENKYRSYYVWEEGRASNHLTPPNSWKSVYNCKAWEFTTEKNSHYLHQFLDSQPDLNLRSEKVRVELETILKFWLDLGVDGFHIRDADYLFEDYDLRDDVLLDNSTTVDCDNQPSSPYSAYSHDYTKGLTELFDMLARWRAYLDVYGNKTNKYKMLIADVEADYDHVMHYYGLFNRDGVDFPLNRFSLNLTSQDGVKEAAAIIDNWLSRLPPGRWANWMGGDHQSVRLADRLGPQMSMLYLIMTMLLPGTPYLYYGDEIGMGMSTVNDSLVVPGGRYTPTRGPMLWDGDIIHAGFCQQYCKEPWLPPFAGYKTDNINVEAQKKDPYSVWHLVKNLTQLRRDYPSFEYGDFVRTVQDDQVYSFVREFDGQKGFLVALNFADQDVRRHFTDTHDTIPSGGTIEIVSGRTSRRRGNSIDLDPLHLQPQQGIVVSWEYKPEEI